MSTKFGAKQISKNLWYYTPHVPDFVDLSDQWKYRKHDVCGTMVRNSDDEEWQYYWDTTIE